MIPSEYNLNPAVPYSYLLKIALINTPVLTDFTCISHKNVGYIVFFKDMLMGNLFCIPKHNNWMFSIASNSQSCFQQPHIFIRYFKALFILIWWSVTGYPVQYVTEYFPIDFLKLNKVLMHKNPRHRGLCFLVLCLVRIKYIYSE